MEDNQYILQRCQFEECEATIFIKGPYCTTHTDGINALKPTTVMMPSSTPGHQQSSNHQHSQRPASPPKSNPTAAIPQSEKLGDAITVKAPLPMAGPVNEKKHLPTKMVARKTAGNAFSTSKHEPVGTRKSEPKLPSYASSTRDIASSSQRPPKRPRLSTDMEEGEVEAYRRVSSFSESGSYPSPVAASTNIGERDHEPVAASDFALRPKKEISSSLETPSRSRSQDDRSASKPFYKDRPRKQQGLYDNSKGYKVPTHGIIDLTEDDSPHFQPPSKVVESPKVSTEKHEEDHTGGPNPRIAHINSESGREGESIKVHVSKNKDTNKLHRNSAASRKEQNGVRKTSSNSTIRPLPRKPHVHIAPRPAPTLPSPDSQVASPPTEPKPANDKQDSVHRPKSPLETPAAEAYQNDNQDQQRNEVPEPTEDTGRIVNGIAANHPPVTSTAPTTVVTPNTTTVNGVHRISQIPTKEQVNEYIRNILENPTRINIPTPKSPRIDLGTPLPRLNSEEASNPTHQSPNRGDSDPSGTQILSRSQVAEKRPLAKRHQDVPKAAQLTNNRNAAKRPANPPVSKSTFASIVQNRRWKHLNPEERRQVWISKHDPDKFDSYIYGKPNEANRPGSTSFALPEYQQPPRPTRPATHFSHIDPRVHWTRPRSKKWYLGKQNEIRERGSRKSNFGQVAARTVKRRREEGDDAPIVDLPDRVRNNPAWLSALDELDAMADQYYAQRHHARQKGIQQKEMEGKIMVMDEDSDIEMEDPAEVV
ncbi:hypothetical protein F4813DRAFT_242837 [Daldinia decipiens]|uniref:uncharacterized protein n=1 Tax=Daldinia decipiens TaxID=326647 RepID=UPI0020C3C939|nr:uncharacterized protein F4813DRAFT_242837 [Daldinia decipiens]KAI1653907.1 hypothetical protein F4813DRAFT_242837 [Daldinia decipiens]